ncbi:TIGR02281 family clan AA aspartic protease [Stappia taiwanensis]|uniref:TIGR02281 family clan AA aspartic protease n=1 Tax=Stappia taiwanensis TaxID=992267 RepID=A0A838XR63_9HYPH|nr:TIGR02281 family clan AA aspartic protease [Stappia taiwanensis]MBA4612782.1 TIGR02281 family clan AA aspartic protease [Stappia taiwanensis]GGE90104.1 membrane protein [Stappia taiwanensis]
MLRYLVIAAVVVVAAIFGPRLTEQVLDRAATETRAASVSDEDRRPRTGKRTLVIKADRSGHFRTTVRLNNRPVDALIDTGATAIALPAEVARRSGVRPRASDYTVRVRTANGMVRAAPMRIGDVRLGSIRLRNVDALVMPEGALEVTLVGMSALGLLRTVDIRAGTMRLVQ